MDYQTFTFISIARMVGIFGSVASMAAVTWVLADQFRQRRRSQTPSEAAPWIGAATILSFWLGFTRILIIPNYTGGARFSVVDLSYLPLTAVGLAALGIINRDESQRWHWIVAPIPFLLVEFTAFGWLYLPPS